MKTSHSVIWGAERARRQQILTWLLYACGGFVLLLLILLLVLSGFSARNQVLLLELGGLVIAIGIALILARSGQMEVATHILFIGLIAAAVATSLPSGATSSALYTMFIPIVGATMMLRPAWSFGYAGLALIAYMSVYLFGARDTPPSPGGILLTTLLFAGHFGIVALLAYLSSRGYEKLLTASLLHAEELERTRNLLVVQVDEQTKDLRQALADLQNSSELIGQMSVPVMPIADGVLLLPLVGALDTQRATLVTERLLESVQREHARTVLIDITGVPLVDTQVAGAILRASQAVQLLGAEPVLVGIRAEVAQTMVGLGLTLGQINTRRDLRSGLAYALGAEVVHHYS